ncbi:MAG TPA: hypothetical protein VN914_07990 [Polyangia bacterium]|nr:hypothetical protein [Polyangia bacterium]
MTERIDGWPVSVLSDGERTYLGVFDRLGDGRSYPASGTVPTLEEIGGDDWSGEVLAQLLPAERVWAWWTRTAVHRNTGLGGERAPAAVDVSTISRPLVRRLLLERMTLAILPAADSGAQASVLEWAGVDTDLAEQVWTAPDGARWNLDEIVSWCQVPEQWRDRSSVTRQPAERIVTLFDSQIFCALAPPAAKEAMKRLETLARRWGLRVVPGPPEYAWVAPLR